MNLTYTLRQLREELQLRTNNAALELISKLEREHGFPRRLPCCSPPKWSRPAVDCWFANWDDRPVLMTVATGIEGLRKSLEEKYA